MHLAAPNSESLVHPGYSIVREVAQGVLTVVYEAIPRHPRLSQHCLALKILRNRADASWFLRVAQTTACLDHPHIVPCHEFGETGEYLYMALTFVQGDDLQNGIGENALRPAKELLRVIRETAAALDFAHNRGIVHGYVHPRHILVGEDGHASLIGFGEYPPPHPMAYGNPVHLAPEQFSAEDKVTVQSDVFCLSETAFWLLGGVHPSQGIQVSELLLAKAQGPRHSMTRLRPGTPPAVDSVLRKGMMAQPHQRFASAGAFAEALTLALETGDIRPKRSWTFWR